MLNMKKFELNGIDFSVDENETNFQLTDDFLQIHIQGKALPSATLLTKAGLDWVIYPPIFHVRCNTSRLMHSGDFLNINFNEDELDEIDSSIVLMEHWDVNQVSVSIGALDGVFSITGVVLIDDGFPFFITGRIQN